MKGETKTHRKLNPRQKKFCLEYIKSNNGKQSAINAGYAEKTAEVTASKLLRVAKVKEFIQKYTQAESDKLNYSAKEVLKDLILEAKKTMDTEVTEVFYTDKETKEQKLVKIEKKKIKNKDKLKSLELLAKYFRIFDENENSNQEKGISEEFFEKIIEKEEDREDFNL